MSTTTTTMRSICRNCGVPIRSYGRCPWVHTTGDDCDGCEGCNSRLEYDPQRGTVLSNSGTTAEPVDESTDLVTCAQVYCGARFFFVAARTFPTLCTDHAAQMPEGSI